MVETAAVKGSHGEPPCSSALLDALRRRADVDDAEFDAVYPPSVRGAPSTFWTPVSVALRAADLLTTDEGTRVLDVGSGIGKFCIIGAAATGATFVGVEQRRHLVEIAEDAARRVGVSTARFEHRSLDGVDAADFDALYFFNPFEENLWTKEDQLDQSVALSRERFVEDVERAERLLAAARTGTRVATYHGFGGAMPAGYRLALRERHPRSYLDLWVKIDSAP